MQYDLYKTTGLLKQKNTVIFIHFDFLNGKGQFSIPRTLGPEN